MLVPPTVALHELGHAALIWAHGLEVQDWMFIGYMGAVWHQSAGELGDFFIALAGNVTTLLIGVGALLYGLHRPGHPVRNVLYLELGRQSLFLVLTFYPAICLFFPGDFQTIYDFEETPIASGITAVVHGAILAIGWGYLWRGRWRARAALLTSPLAPVYVELERRRRESPEDAAIARDLGLFLAIAGEVRRARGLLEEALERGRADPRVYVALGGILSEAGEHERAIGLLERGLDGLLRPEERLTAELPLLRSMLALGRREQARTRLEPLLRSFPEHRELRELEDRARA